MAKFMRENRGKEVVILNRRQCPRVYEDRPIGKAACVHTVVAEKMHFRLTGYLRDNGHQPGDNPANAFKTSGIVVGQKPLGSAFLDILSGYLRLVLV